MNNNYSKAVRIFKHLCIYMYVISVFVVCIGMCKISCYYLLLNMYLLFYNFI